MMCVQFKLIGHEFKQFLLHFQYIASGGDVGSVGDAEDVCIHGDGRVTKGGVKDDIGGLATDAGQCLQGFTIIRHLALVLFDQDGAGLDDIVGLTVKQADGLNVILKSCLAELQNFLGRVGPLEQTLRGLVDALVGGLRRQDDSDQQFERCAIHQFCGG